MRQLYIEYIDHSEWVVKEKGVIGKLIVMAVLSLLTSCASMGWVEYEGDWISGDRYKEIVAQQHKVFDDHDYSDGGDMKMSIKKPR